jgi:hypothetical protein
MDADSDEGWLHVPLSVLDRQEEYRRVAALENASLEVQHESSRLQEQAIAAEMEALESQRNALQISADHSSELPVTGVDTEMHMFGGENFQTAVILQVHFRVIHNVDSLQVDMLLLNLLKDTLQQTFLDWPGAGYRLRA